jgi:hypothetical protein
LALRPRCGPATLVDRVSANTRKPRDSISARAPSRARQTPTRVWLGQECFVVVAEALPPGINQRPGVTLLLGRGGPLSVEILDAGVRSGWAFLLAPEQRRRFVGAQPHDSVTVEPGHALYTGYLAWAREAANSEARRAQLADAPARVVPSALEQLPTRGAFDQGCERSCLPTIGRRERRSLS